MKRDIWRLLLLAALVAVSSPRAADKTWLGEVGGEGASEEKITLE